MFLCYAVQLGFSLLFKVLCSLSIRKVYYFILLTAYKSLSIMEQNEFVASLVLICFLMSVNSNSTDDNDLLRVKFECTQGDYYDLEYGGCVMCTICKRENMKTMTPCSFNRDTVCRDCEDGYEQQQQGTSIRCIRLQSADKNDDLVHPGGDNDLALNSSPSQPSHSTTVTVIQTSTERKPINNASTSNDINAPNPIPSSNISIFMEHKGKRIAL